MRKEKRSVAVIIFAFLEIILGAAGSVLLIKNALAYLVILRDTNGSTGISGALALVGVVMYLPAPLILTSGLFVLVSLSLGKDMNNKALMFMYFLCMMIVGFHIYTKHFDLIITDILLFFVSTVPIQWFLAQPEIKNLETKQY